MYTKLTTSCRLSGDPDANLGLRKATSFDVSKGVLSFLLTDENQLEQTFLVTKEQRQGFEAIVQMWSEGEISSDGVQKYFSKYIGYTYHLSDKERLHITNGVLALLVAEAISNKLGRFDNDIYDVIAHILELTEGGDVPRDIRELRTKVRKFICSPLNLWESSHYPKHVSHRYIFLCTKLIVRDAIEKMKSKTCSIKSLFLKSAIKPLLNLAQTTSESVLSQISNNICGYFFPSFSPQR